MKFHEMTAAKLRKVDREKSLVVIPIAAVEQHGPHLPTGTDTILCTAVAEAVESRLASEVVLTPTYWLGASAHHTRLGATFDCSLEKYITTLCELAGSMLDDGFVRVMFLNGHGGNVDPMRVAVRILQSQYAGCLLAAGSYWCVADELMKTTLTGDHKFVGHACEFETSLMLHLRPELVDTSQLADAGELITDQIDGVLLSRDMKQRTAQGFTGRPDLATADKGKQLLEGIVNRLVVTMQSLLAQPLAADYSGFGD